LHTIAGYPTPSHELNDPYRQVVGWFAREFVRRQPGAAATKADGVFTEENLHRGAQYQLEEAAFCMLVGDLWNIQVLIYPGSIRPFQEVSEGKIPGAPEELRRLRLVSLDLRRQWLPGEKPPRVKDKGKDKDKDKDKDAEPRSVDGCLTATE
jgi:hypothetical protein